MFSFHSIERLQEKFMVQPWLLKTFYISDFTFVFCLFIGLSFKPFFFFAKCKTTKGNK